MSISKTAKKTDYFLTAGNLRTQIACRKERMMEKYTNLEDALRDTSLVILTDRITTLTELLRAYARFKVLPSPQRRFSNYYSAKFLGHNVPEMYDMIKDRLIGDSDIMKDLPLQDNAYLVSEPDLYYKEESFNRGDINLCLTLGHSGSGKSVMSRRLEGDEIDHIELDDLLLVKDHFTMEDVENYSDLFAAFFHGDGAKYYIGLDERNSLPKEEYEDRLFVDFVSFAMDYAKQHREKKYLLDGIWIYLYFDDPSVFEDYAVFIKGTSFLKSKIRTAKRELQRDPETLQDRKNMFGRETRHYLLDEVKIDRYRSYFGDKPETVFRAETSTSAETVINELNLIDSCFASNDADGIKVIKEKARADTALSSWDKIRIVTECEEALLDLKRESFIHA